MRDGQVVKGVRFRDHRVVGDILDLAQRYRDQGADELVFYDITASPEDRSVDRSWVRRVARLLDIPFCVAGGIRSVADAEEVLGSGAEKISLNSPALEDPELIDGLSRRFGAQCVVVGIDSQSVGGDYRVQQYTGDPARTRDAARRTLDWVVEAQRRGAGEIVLNCMASDGVRQGYDIDQLRAVRGVCGVPLVASGGAGSAAAFYASVSVQRRRCGARGQRVSFRRNRDTGSQKTTTCGRHRGENMIGPDELDWSKSGGLLPAIVQDADSGAVLMLAYMNREALAATQSSGRVTFWSRQQAAAVDQGRDLRPFSRVARHGRGLRRGHAIDSGETARSGVSFGHARPVLARPRRKRSPDESPSSRPWKASSPSAWQRGPRTAIRRN